MLDRIFTSWVTFTQIARKRFAWIGYVLVAVSVIYLAALLFINWGQFSTIPWEHFWKAGLISLFLYLFSQIPQLAIWLRMMTFHHKVGWNDFKIFFQSMLLRRIPGGVWHWVGRISLYSGTTEITPKTVLYANFLEWSLIILVAVGIVFLGEPVSDKIGIFSIFGAIGAWSAAVAFAYKWFPSKVLKKARILESISWLLVYAIAWLMGGLIIYVFSQSDAGYSITFWDALWVWAVAGGISWVIIIIPSGLGVREITLMTLLNPYIGTSQALVIAVGIRLVFLVADFVWGGLGWLIGHWLDRHAKRLASIPPPDQSFNG